MEKTMEEKSYSTLDIVKKLDIPRERLREWIDRGFIVPSIERSSGQGTKNLFSRKDVYLIALFEKFLVSGISRKMAARLIQDYKKNYENEAKNIKTGEIIPLGYILYRYSIKDKMVKINTIGLQKDAHLKMDISTGQIYYEFDDNKKTLKIKESMKKMSIPVGEDWDTITLINLDKIRTSNTIT